MTPKEELDLLIGPLSQLQSLPELARSAGMHTGETGGGSGGGIGGNLKHLVSSGVSSGMGSGMGKSLLSALTGSPAEGGMSAGKVLGSILGSGFGLVSVGKAIAGLFGGSKPEPPPLVKFSLPQAIHMESANVHGEQGLQGVRYSQEGLPDVAGMSSSGLASGAMTSSGAAQQSNITVQVNAMDSRSFLDHSDEIAAAVRQAMLNMHPINDMVSEL